MSEEKPKAPVDLTVPEYITKLYLRPETLKTFIESPDASKMITLLKVISLFLILYSLGVLRSLQISRADRGALASGQGRPLHEPGFRPLRMPEGKSQPEPAPQL